MHEDGMRERGGKLAALDREGKERALPAALRLGLKRRKLAMRSSQGKASRKMVEARECS